MWLAAVVEATDTMNARHLRQWPARVLHIFTGTGIQQVLTSTPVSSERAIFNRPRSCAPYPKTLQANMLNHLTIYLPGTTRLARRFKQRKHARIHK